MHLSAEVHQGQLVAVECRLAIRHLPRGPFPSRPRPTGRPSSRQCRCGILRLQGVGHSSTNGSSDGMVSRPTNSRVVDQHLAGQVPGRRVEHRAAVVPVVAPVAAVPGQHDAVARPVVVEMVGDRAPLVRVLRRPAARRGTPRPGSAAAGSAPRRAARRPTTWPLALVAPGRATSRRLRRCPAAAPGSPAPGTGASPAAARWQVRRHRRPPDKRSPPGSTGSAARKNEIPASTSSRGRGRRSRPSRATAVSAQLSSTMTALRSAPRGRSRSSRSRPARTGWAASRATTPPGSERVEHLGTGVTVGVGEQRRQQPGQVGDDDQAGRHCHVREAAAQPEHHHDQGGHDAAGGAAHGREHQRHRHRRAPRRRSRRIRSDASATQGSRK